MKNTVATFAQAKAEGRKLAMLTAYDYSTAKLEDEPAIEQASSSATRWQLWCSVTRHPVRDR